MTTTTATALAPDAHVDRIRYSGLIAMTLMSFLLVTAEFLPNGVLTELAASLGVTPGQAGQTVTSNEHVCDNGGCPCALPLATYTSHTAPGASGATAPAPSVSCRAPPTRTSIDESTLSSAIASMLTMSVRNHEITAGIPWAWVLWSAMTEPPAWLVKGAAAALRTRWFVRSPIGLYRRGLGWMLGDRLLMLEHKGRTSGLVRRAVVEVIGTPMPGRYLIVAGFGERTDWLRNVRAHQGVRVSTGRLQSAPAVAHELSADEVEDALAAYQVDHPIAWKVLSSTMQQSLGTDLSALTVVALDLET